MSRAPDPVGFLADPMLCPLSYSTGLPVMRGDVQLLYHARDCSFVSRAAGRVIQIRAFDPSAWTDEELAAFADKGSPGLTDLASIPSLARNRFPPNGRYLKPALKHDQGYETTGYGLVDRAAVDHELLADMKAVGCSWIERTVIYNAVRIGGASGWGR